MRHGYLRLSITNFSQHFRNGLRGVGGSASDNSPAIGQRNLHLRSAVLTLWGTGTQPLNRWTTGGRPACGGQLDAGREECAGRINQILYDVNCKDDNEMKYFNNLLIVCAIFLSFHPTIISSANCCTLSAPTLSSDASVSLTYYMFIRAYPHRLIN